MTAQEAIKLLHPDTTKEAIAEIKYYCGFHGKEAAIKAIEEACLLACDALEKQVPKAQSDTQKHVVTRGVMAKEYIEREAATRILTEAADAYGTYTTERGIYLTAREKVKNIPAADVAEVVHGKWVYAKTYYDIDECNCSLCGQLMTTAIDKRMNYCPNCGAKMDGGEEQ